MDVICHSEATESQLKTIYTPRQLLEEANWCCYGENIGFQEHTPLSFCNSIHTCTRILERFILYSFALRIFQTVLQYELKILSSFLRFFRQQYPWLFFHFCF